MQIKKLIDMPWKPPSFWKNDNSWARALTPASAVYQKIQQTLYNKASPYRASIPVICVGNVQLGGSGKTPAAMALCQLIVHEKLAANPVVLLRGYGGQLKGPSLVDPVHHRVTDVGDEALLHALHAPAIISRDRAAGARLAEAAGYDLIIMDDGLQNNQLEKTLSFLIFNTDQGLGNNLVFPAGPLREPVETAVEKAHAVLRVGTDLPFEISIPVFDCHISAPVTSDTNQPYLAFCGIGQPDKFLKTLHDCHYNIADFISFPDHYSYNEKTLESLRTRAQAINAHLITTEKDWIRLPPEWKADINVLKISYIFDQKNQLISFLKKALLS